MRLSALRPSYCRDAGSCCGLGESARAEDRHELIFGDTDCTDAKFVERAALGFDVLGMNVFCEEIGCR